MTTETGMTTQTFCLGHDCGSVIHGLPQTHPGPKEGSWARELLDAQEKARHFYYLLSDVRQTVNPLAAYPWLLEKIEQAVIEGKP